MKRVALASGIELDVIDLGPRDAPALIFLHGFPESHRTWRHQISHLANHFRCIAPDQRGYRGSSKPADVSAYAPDRLIADVFQLADTLGIERFTIIGHDWGGAIAWGVALLGQGSRVDRAVIANAPHPVIFQRLLYTDPVQRAASQYMRVFRDPANDMLVQANGLGAMMIKAFGGPDIGALDPAMRDRLLALATDPQVRADQLADWQDRDAAFAMLNWYRASPIDVPLLDAPYGLPAGWVPPLLPLLKVPTLVIWALDDRALPPCNLQGMAAIIPDLTLVEVPDCGHFVPWENPGAVNTAMDTFFGR